MKNFGHTRPRRAPATGEVLSLKASPARAVTLGVLGANHGSDKGRRLVVALEVGDCITFRPYGTRRFMSARAVDVYEWILRSKAVCEQMRKLRERKAAKAQRLATARQASAEKRLFRKEAA